MKMDDRDVRRNRQGGGNIIFSERPKAHEIEDPVLHPAFSSRPIRIPSWSETLFAVDTFVRLSDGSPVISVDHNIMKAILRGGRLHEGTIMWSGGTVIGWSL